MGFGWLCVRCGSRRSDREVEQASSVKPFLKWAGGKSRLVPKLKPFLPNDLSSRTYYEPFLGSGALFFELAPARAHLSDANARLIRTYLELRRDPAELVQRIEALRALEYNELRSRFNRAPCGASFILLNKTCFNGVYRVNAKGEFNVPKGRFASEPKVYCPVELERSAMLLRRASVRHGSYLSELVRAEHDRAFVYLDPPYDRSWTGYTAGGFDAGDQEALRDACLRLDAAGAYWLLSNHDTPLVRELYRGFYFDLVDAPRSVGKSRVSVPEVVIRNYETP